MQYEETTDEHRFTQIRLFPGYLTSAMQNRCRTIYLSISSDLRISLSSESVRICVIRGELSRDSLPMGAVVENHGREDH